MPRGRQSQSARRKAIQAMRYEQMCHAALTARRAHHARESALALRKATPDWVDLGAQIKHHQLEAEMDAMEAAINARRPTVPVLDFDLMPRFKPPQKADPEVHEPKIHEDVKIQAELLKLQEPRPKNENTSPPLGGKNWKYTSDNTDRRPEDDWRNWD